MKTPKGKRLEEAIYLWFVERKSKGEPVASPLLCGKTIELNNELKGSPDFKASAGWLKNFKSRHGIQELKVQKDVLAVQKFEGEFFAFLEKEGFSFNDIYNTEETSLYWKSLPLKSLASRQKNSIPDFKVSNERITIMIATNATGSHLLPPLMVGKVKNPWC